MNDLSRTGTDRFYFNPRVEAVARYMEKVMIIGILECCRMLLAVERDAEPSKRLRERMPMECYE